MVKIIKDDWLFVDICYAVNTIEYRHSRNQAYLINYHLIWCSKRRKKDLLVKY